MHDDDNDAFNRLEITATTALGNEMNIRITVVLLTVLNVTGFELSE